jgi:hypothetical protein
MGGSLWTKGQEKLYAALVLIDDSKTEVAYSVYRQELEGIAIDISSDGSSVVNIPFSGNTILETGNKYAIIFLPADVSKAKTIGVDLTLASTPGYAKGIDTGTCTASYFGSGTTFISDPYYPWGNNGFVGSVVGYDTINYAIGIQLKAV